MDSVEATTQSKTLVFKTKARFIEKTREKTMIKEQSTQKHTS